MSEPPPYPRIPYLLRPDSLGRDDVVLAADEVARWLRRPVVVEEKLDGANVSLWLEDGVVRVASRGGADASDRGGQLGRLRAWAAERHPLLGPALADGRALYGEWMWRRHTVRYDALPDWFVLLDVRTAGGAFLPLADRDQIARDAGLVTPPLLFSGVLESLDTLLGLLGRSAFSSEPAEGAVLRAGEERVKLVRPGFVRFADEAWGRLAGNRLAANQGT